MSIIRLTGVGPGLDLSFHYNSASRRVGPLGPGWSHSYENRIFEATDEVSMFAICNVGSGKQDVFARSADGTYTAPPHLRDVLTRHSDGSFVLRGRDGVSRLFDNRGRLTAVSDLNGNSTTLTYDAVGFLTTITDTFGRVVTLTRDPNGRIASLVDPAGNVYRFSYSEAGLLESVADPLGNTTRFSYGADPDDSQAPASSASRLSTIPRLSGLTDPRGNLQHAMYYDKQGRVATWQEGDETWTFQYDPISRITKKRDSSGNMWTAQYNEIGGIVRKTDPLGGVETFELDANFNVLSFTDKNGSRTRYTYDSFGNKTSVVDALGNSVALEWDTALNKPVSTKDPLGNQTALSYDSKGNLTKVSDPLGGEQSYTYDSKGLVTSLTNAIGLTTSSTYDEYGNLLRQTNPQNHTQSWVFDVLGNLASITDENGNKTTFVNDANGRVVRQVDAAGAVTSFEYDESGNRKAVTLANGGKFLYEYDNRNRLQRTINPIGKITTFTYDRKGNVASKTDANGVTTYYSYDPLGRLLSRTGGSDPLTFAYDKNGNVTSIRNTNATLTYVYDALNRVTEARTSASAHQPDTTMKYAYDSSGRRSSMTDPDGGVTTYTYDAASRLASIQSPGSMTFTFNYDKAGRLVGMSGPAGRSVTYRWDSASRLSGIADQAAASDLTLSYSRDPVGNILSRAGSLGATAYTYDSLHQLRTATHPAGQASESYTYDNMGNRVRTHLSSSYTHDAANRLLSDGTFDYSYDNNGNLVRRAEKSGGRASVYGFDSENRMVEVRTPEGATFSYKYDGLGRRIAKIGGASGVQYVYDGPNILAEYSSRGVRQATYVHGLGIDELLAVRRGSTLSYFQKDHLGSVLRVVGPQGVTTSFVYDSYGTIVRGGEQSPAPFAFTGREFDSESGLYFYRARFYNSRSGRFISEDPIGFAGGINFYAFVGNNPIIYIDPLGLKRLDIEKFKSCLRRRGETVGVTCLGNFLICLATPAKATCLGIIVTCAAIPAITVNQCYRDSLVDVPPPDECTSATSNVDGVP